MHLLHVPEGQLEPFRQHLLPLERAPGTNPAVRRHDMRQRDTQLRVQPLLLHGGRLPRPVSWNDGE